jgi:hypothetical protein
MPLVLEDRVREQSTTIGAGTFTLTGAVIGYQTFSGAIGNGNTCYYTISNPGTTEWEVGIGTVSAGQLARTTILSSSNAGSLVTFTAGTKDVFVTYPSEKAVYLDASGNVSALGTVNSGTWQGTAITVPYGGTGATSFTSGALIKGAGTGPLAPASASDIVSAIGSTAVQNATAAVTSTNLAGGTASQIPYQSGAGATTFIANGTSGQILKSNGASAPSWESVSALSVTTFSAGTTGFTPSTATGGAVTLAGTLALANGGTGATTVSGAQTNLQVDPAGTAVAMAIALG